MTTHVLTEHDRANGSVVAVNDFHLEEDISILMIEGVERDPPAILIIRITEDTGVGIADPEDLHGIRKGIVEIAHVD